MSNATATPSMYVPLDAEEKEVANETLLPLTSDPQQAEPELASGETILVDHPRESTEATAGTLPAEPKASEGEESEGATMISLARQDGMKFARDINTKIDDLETHIGSLTHAFADSQDLLRTTLHELKNRTHTMTHDIERVAQRLEDSSDKQMEMTRALDERFRESMIDVSTRLGHAWDSLQDQQGQLEQLEQRHSSLEDLHQALGQTTSKHGLTIEALTQDTQQRFESTGEHIANLHVQQDEQLRTLKALTEELDCLAAKVGLEADKLAAVEVNAAEHTRVTRQNFQIVAGVLGGLTLAVAGAMTWLHLQPDAALVQAQTDIAALSSTVGTQISSNEALQTEFTVLKSQLSGLEAAIKQHAGDNATLKGDLAQFSRDVASLKAATSSTQANNQEITLLLSALETKVKGLQAKVAPPRINGTVTPVLPIQSAEWLARQSPDHYSIQLVGVYRYPYIVSYVNQYSTDLSAYPLATNKSLYQGRDWHNLYYGNFATFSEAQAAIAKLPVELQTASPWIRSMASIQKSAIQ